MTAGSFGLARDALARAGQDAGDLVAEADGGAHVLQVDDAHALLELGNEGRQAGLVDEGARGDDHRHAGGTAGGLDVGGAAGEVDHGRHAADGLQGEERHGHARRVRQHDADGAAHGRQRLELGAQHLGAEDQLAIAELGAQRIAQRRLARVARLPRIGQRRKQGAIEARRLDRGVDHDVLQRQAGRLAARLALEGGIHGEPARGQERHLELGEQRLLGLGRAQIAEGRALRALDAHRHEPRIGLVDDHARAVVGLHQAAGERDAPFREDDHGLARLHGVDDGARGQRLGRLQQVGVDDAQERAHPPGLRDLVVDGEARLLGQDGVQQRPVEQAHVVGGEDDALAGTGNVLEAGHLQPKKKLEHRAAGVAHDLRAPGVHDIGDGGDAEHAERGEQQRHADAYRLQHRDDAARAHHVGGVEDVDGGDDARAPVHRGPRLHGGERRAR